MKFSLKQKRSDPTEQDHYLYTDQERYLGSQASPVSNTTLYYLIKDLTDNILELRAELNSVQDIRKFQIDILKKRQERMA